MFIEEQRKPRSRAFFVVLWLSMLVISISLIIVVLNSLNVFFSPQRLVSLDWGGYVVATDYSNPAPVIKSVGGIWIVPKVIVTPDDRLSAAWIGIGGYVDTTLIQVGTEHDSINGSGVYSAWYELLPETSVNITTMRIHAGDRINASIMLIDPTANSWIVRIEDTTTGQSFNKEFAYNSSRLSAEWIVERPSLDNSLSSLADFGSVTFTNAIAANNVTQKAINGFPFARVTMYDRQNRQLVSISSLSTDGESFTVNYQSADSVMSNSISYFENTGIMAASNQTVRNATARSNTLSRFSPFSVVL